MVTVMAVTKQKKWTYEEYYRLDDEKRYEVIEGELIEMSSPSSEHQIITGNLSSMIWVFLKENNLGQVIPSPIDVIFDEQNTFQPDIVFISSKNKQIIQERGVFGPPDLVVEVLSKSTEKKDRGIKFKAYEKFGVKEYWLVDPRKRSMEVFVLEKSTFISYNFVKNADPLKSRVFPDFSVRFSELS
ncbi:MAG: hypothetical protein IEMM0008_1327 [bacterium]|nr:MAG: hypothetical protein IEMM0008_1327 [bacterium]